MDVPSHTSAIASAPISAAGCAPPPHAASAVGTAPTTPTPIAQRPRRCRKRRRSKPCDEFVRPPISLIPLLLWPHRVPRASSSGPLARDAKRLHELALRLERGALADAPA